AAVHGASPQARPARPLVKGGLSRSPPYHYRPPLVVIRAADAVGGSDPGKVGGEGPRLALPEGEGGVRCAGLGGVLEDEHPRRAEQPDRGLAAAGPVARDRREVRRAE